MFLWVFSEWDFDTKRYYLRDIAIRLNDKEYREEYV